jgi:hypothetical protein
MCASNPLVAVSNVRAMGARRPMAWRENYLEAFHLIESGRGCAIKMFEILAAERNDDPVPARMAERQRANNDQPICAGFWRSHRLSGNKRTAKVRATDTT